MPITWLSLLPPLLVIITIIITHRLNISLILGIISAALIASDRDMYAMFNLIVQRCTEHFTDINNIYLYCALIAISSLITLLTITGSAAACARIIGQKVRSKQGIQTSSMLLSLMLSIDDYLSILTVGFVMRPLADRMAIARLKLAYLTHSLSGPLAIIMPISTWAATILAQLENAGIGNNATTTKIIADPFYAYLHIIPFIFYSSITAVSVLFIVYRKISYGPLGEIEKNCVPEIQNDSSDINTTNHSLIELAMPLLILIGGVTCGILYFGGYTLFGGDNSFFEAFKNNNQTFFILLIAGLAAFSASTVLSLSKRILTLQKIPLVFIQGALLMYGPITMVILASILGSFLRTDLHTGNYIAYLLLGSTPLCLIPALLYITALAITITTGSAWGTFSLLIPITTEMLISFLQLETPVPVSHITLFFPTIGALLSGASCGDHISPVSETTIMTATSTGTDSFEHARTQFFYALPVIIGTFAAFIVSGLLCSSTLIINFSASLATGLAISLALLMFLNTIWKK